MTNNPGGSFEYTANPSYFTEFEFPRLQAARVTALCVAQWATHVVAWPVGYGHEIKEREVLGSVFGPEQIVDELWRSVQNWWDRQEPELAGYAMIGLLLKRGTDLLLDQHDGIPANLFLRAEEFQKLGECWSKHDFPTDLYVKSG
jgi:hypothetical protein